MENNSCGWSIQQSSCIGNDDNGKDDKWYQQLLQRAGINLSTASKKSEDEPALRNEYNIKDIFVN